MEDFRLAYRAVIRQEGLFFSAELWLRGASAGDGPANNGGNDGPGGHGPGDQAPGDQGQGGPGPPSPPGHPGPPPPAPGGPPTPPRRASRRLRVQGNQVSSRIESGMADAEEDGAK